MFMLTKGGDCWCIRNIPQKFWFWVFYSKILRLRISPTTGIYLDPIQNSGQLNPTSLVFTDCHFKQGWRTRLEIAPLFSFYHTV